MVESKEQIVNIVTISKYNGLSDRKTKINKQEAKGLRMFHDDFDSDWKFGENPRGTMTFTDTPEITIPIVPNLADKIDSLEVRITQLER